MSYRNKFIALCTQRAKILARKLTWEEVITLATETHENLIKPTARGSNVPPPPEDVTKYSEAIEYPMDGQKWCDHYAAKGWIVSGRARMKDWKAACRNWKSSGWGQENGIALRKQAKNGHADARYIEPAGDWRLTAKALFKMIDLPATWKTWHDVPLNYREQIAKSHKS